ncbi:MAG: DeoR/GlpR transcriptional regulator [Planctomycetales bacterium]|nr:DeoR/GlpR transcriptional regulator [Planctomycetales bacterium]
MTTEVRRSRILELVRGRGFATLPELASEMDVSESTIRRDLGRLEEAGIAKRTHGGVLYTGQTPGFLPVDTGNTEVAEKKAAIARRTAELIEDGDTVLLDGGTTTYEVARELVGRRLQVVTDSLPVANLFMTRGESDLIIVGGYLHSRTGVLVGPHAKRMLSEINVQKAVLSVAAISDGGFYNSNMLLVEVKRAVMAAADMVIVVADSTKFGHKSLTQLCDWNDVDYLVVDNEISEDWRSKVVATGTKLLLAGKTDNG